MCTYVKIVYLNLLLLSQVPLLRHIYVNVSDTADLSEIYLQ